MTKEKLLDIHVNVNANDVIRNILSFNENKKGDVYIRLLSGDEATTAPGERRIKEHRYSIHMTPDNLEYNALKQTMRLVNGEEKTTMAYTNAIKGNVGFSQLFVHRFTNLSSEIYDNIGKLENALFMGEFDPQFSCLYLGIYVGALNSCFPDVGEGIKVHRIVSSNFQIVILAHQLNTPSLPAGATSTKFTVNPDYYSSDEARNNVLMMMQAMSVDDCIKEYKFFTKQLAINLMQLHLNYVGEESEHADYIRMLMQSIPK